MSCILGEEDPKERSKFGMKIEFFYFFLKFGLACRKIEASQRSWYKGVGGLIFSFKIDHPNLHNNRCPCYCPFSDHASHQNYGLP